MFCLYLCIVHTERFSPRNNYGLRARTHTQIDRESDQCQRQISANGQLKCQRQWIGENRTRMLSAACHMNLIPQISNANTKSKLINDSCGFVCLCAFHDLFVDLEKRKEKKRIAEKQTENIIHLIVRHTRIDIVAGFIRVFEKTR